MSHGKNDSELSYLGNDTNFIENKFDFYMSDPAENGNNLTTNSTNNLCFEVISSLQSNEQANNTPTIINPLNSYTIDNVPEGIHD